MTTLLQLKTRARERADQENSEFIAESELLDYINNSYLELYDLVTAQFQDYFLQNTEISVVSGDYIPLPNDFYKLRGVDLKNSENNYTTLQAFSFEQRNQNTYIDLQPRHTTSSLRYRLQANQIKLTPYASAPGTYQIWYLPTLTLLAQDTDTIVSALNPWSEYIVLDAAIKMAQKEESDVSVFLGQKQALVKRIQAMAANRDSSGPEVVYANSLRDWRLL